MSGASGQGMRSTEGTPMQAGLVESSGPRPETPPRNSVGDRLNGLDMDLQEANRRIAALENNMNRAASLIEYLCNDLGIESSKIL